MRRKDRPRQSTGQTDLPNQVDHKGDDHLSSANSAQPHPDRTFAVLLVDADPHVRKTLTDAITDDSMILHEAANLAEARCMLDHSMVDLVLIDPCLPDGSGMELAQELDRMQNSAQTILIIDEPSLDRAIEAFRAGAVDIIVKPINLQELNERVYVALNRRKSNRQQERRIQRLRRICKKLDGVRQEVAQQVDVLCKDLVTAYQELADQMQHAVRTSEYASLIKSELDLESLLRTTLEYLIEKCGPCNVAIFLPSTSGEYELGGYVNYDCTMDSADMMLQHMADIVAPLVAERNTPIHLTDNQMLTDWIGDDFIYLTDNHVLAFPCRCDPSQMHAQNTSQSDDKSLASIILFRDSLHPFDTDLIDTLSAIGSLFGVALEKVIRIHHRHLNNEDGEFPSTDFIAGV